MATIVGRWKPEGEVSEHERETGSWIWDRSWGRQPASHFQAKTSGEGNSIDFVPGFTPPLKYQKSIRMACAKALGIPYDHPEFDRSKEALVEITQITGYNRHKPPRRHQ
jgi:hypothetical protein